MISPCPSTAFLVNILNNFQHNHFFPSLMPNHNMQIVEILLPIKGNKTFAYQTLSSVETGQFVLVPFRNKKLLGIVWQTFSQFKKESIKEIIQIYEYKLKDSFLEFLKATADYNMIELGIVLKMAINAFSARESFNYINKTNHNFHVFLSSEQSSAFKYLLKNAQQGLVSVIEGVTGSGKTIVYLKLIEELLRNGGQALILLPEIALTTQIMQRFTELPPKINILQWHSGLTPKKRQELWQISLQGDDVIVIGARSALFLPFTNLKVIIIDEEHDASFKQEEGAIYNTRDMAVLRGKIENIPVVLSSATPAIETIYNYKIGKYKKVQLTSRFSGVLLPDIKIIDMTEENLSKNQFISPTLRHALENNLNNAKQSLIFLNRKGYAPITLCTKCGTKLSCPYCSSYLVFHRNKSSLECHHCGYKTKVITECSNCHSKDIIFFGPGVEKIEEELKKLFPLARVAIATSETISNQKSAMELLKKISNHEIDIIIGTQILAKGLDFKLLQLVGVIDADCSYTSGDIRAHERMYQLLSQVSGRAGRANERGQVFLQTYEPHNHILHSIINNNQNAFFEAELQNREASNTPPFSRIAVITISCRQENRLLEFAYKMSDIMPVLENLTVLGPSSAPLSLLKGNYRYRFILRAKKNISIQKIINHWLEQADVPHHIKIKIDVDPYSFS
ncbi:MAG: primosomal protein N' [Candidatus Midichloria sp.]|nr:MAG: primosomal protein N' [Candidatus Midichloria sp.]